MPSPLATGVATALQAFNTDYGTGWTFGENWTNVNTQFETFVNKYLFPKIDESIIISVALGNRFEWLAKEKDFIGQYSEEYVIMDSVPVTMNLSKEETLMLKRNYPAMATKLYGAGILKKQKFTLNNNDVRLNFLTLADATNYALGVYRKKVSDINVSEERELRAMLIDYSLKNITNPQQIRKVTSEQELFASVSEAILNIQNNSALYNETPQASGGAIGQYTTTTKLEDVLILTTDKLKAYLLDTKLANTFQTAGIDLTKRIMSFDTLGGNYRANADIKIADQKTVDFLKAHGDYQVAIGDTIQKGSVFTYAVDTVPEFAGKVEEIKPTSDLFALIIDVNAIKYKRCTNGMLKPPFYNGETDEVTYWLHYYSFKSISPFYNKILVSE